MSDMQKVFNEVKAHLLAQNKKSLRSDTNNLTCAYFDDDGNRCAVGCLIRTSYYDSSLEGKPVMESDVLDALSCSGIDVDEKMLDMLSMLQSVHDNQDVSCWENGLTIVAKSFDLEP